MTMNMNFFNAIMTLMISGPTYPVLLIRLRKKQQQWMSEPLPTILDFYKKARLAREEAGRR